jgi:hypothetical protein
MAKCVKITWLDLNSSYSHSSLALPQLHTCCLAAGIQAEWKVVAATGQNPAATVTRIAADPPEIVAATAYLFTVTPLLQIIRRVKALFPDCTVILGGPEFLGHNEAFLRRERSIDLVLRGEGEVAFPLIIQALAEHSDCGGIAGVCRLDKEGTYHDNGFAAVPTDLNCLPDPAESCFFTTDRPFVQLETARGCPFSCSYCTSGIGSPLRTLTVDRVRRRLNRLRASGLREIRILDRTFNLDPQRSCDLLRLFAADFPDMRFHLEMHPALLNSAVREALAAAPPGQLHIEAGMQSSSAAALHAVSRYGPVTEVWDGLQFLCRAENVAVHVDLLAGLPKGTRQDVFDDLCRLAALHPQEIQLELLKLLPGTALRKEAESCGIRFADDPPYEVLATPEFTVAELEQMRLLALTIDRFYNQPALTDAVACALQERPGWWGDFLSYLCRCMAAETPLPLERRFRLFYDYAVQHGMSRTMRALEYGWLKHGLSAVKGLAAAERWQSPIPSLAVQVDGPRLSAEAVRAAKSQVVSAILTGEPETVYFFVNNRGRRGAVSICKAACRDVPDQE